MELQDGVRVMATDLGYNLSFLMILNSAAFIVFAFSFVKPKTNSAGVPSVVSQPDPGHTK